jgi:hypothetical protein
MPNRTPTRPAAIPSRRWPAGSRPNAPTRPLPWTLPPGTGRDRGERTMGATGRSRSVRSRVRASSARRRLLRRIQAIPARRHRLRHRIRIIRPRRALPGRLIRSDPPPTRRTWSGSSVRGGWATRGLPRPRRSRERARPLPERFPDPRRPGSRIPDPSRLRVPRAWNPRSRRVPDDRTDHAGRRGPPWTRRPTAPASRFGSDPGSPHLQATRSQRHGSPPEASRIRRPTRGFPGRPRRLPARPRRA